MERGNLNGFDIHIIEWMLKYAYYKDENAKTTKQDSNYTILSNSTSPAALLGEG